jgi:hypothetical protein
MQILRTLGKNAYLVVHLITRMAIAVRALSTPLLHLAGRGNCSQFAVKESRCLRARSQTIAGNARCLFL